MSEEETKETTMEAQSEQAAALAAERQARAQLEESTGALNARIAELEGTLKEAKEANDVSTAKEASLLETQAKTTESYLVLARSANPTVPASLIEGATVEEIDAAIEKGKGLVEAVKQSVSQEAAATAAAVAVPAGAPARGGISSEGMSAREKITAGITQKGGNS
jgi:hypothetical protein